MFDLIFVLFDKIKPELIECMFRMKFSSLEFVTLIYFGNFDIKKPFSSQTKANLAINLTDSVPQTFLSRDTLDT